MRVAPHWLLNLVGYKSKDLTLLDNRLYFKNSDKSTLEILPSVFTKKGIIFKGLFFWYLILETDQGKLKVGGLSEAIAYKTFNKIKGYSYQYVQPKVSQLAENIRAQLNDGYLRRSKIDRISLLAKSLYDQFSVLPEEGLVGAAAYQDFLLLSHIATNPENKNGGAWLDEYKASYLVRYRSEYKQYFDEVESNPLTDKQRDACIIDDDHNLVLAGAGTGKTSTMVGRAGFLIKSQQSKPHEILMLAFGNAAAKEMQQRITEKLSPNIDIEGLESSTFHKLGKEIIANVEGAQPSITPLAEDAKALKQQVNKWFETHLKTDAYKKTVLNYFSQYLYPKANPFDFKTEGAYLQYISDNEIRTLKGEQVKGWGECLIANHLFKLGIEYDYEVRYQHDTLDLNFRQYQPDFYLPDYDVYLEHVGIDWEGNTAPYVDRELYHAGLEWKSEVHDKHETQLIETFHYQLMDGCLLAELDKALAIFEVEYNPLPEDALLATLAEFGAISQLADLLGDLLKSYRSNCFKREDERLEACIERAVESNQMRAVLLLLMPIVEDYESYLTKNGWIDFDDMISKALTYVETGRYKPVWQYIMVDEFQDISEPRARLIKALQQASSGCSLFCVGDDWQAIFRFTGSDIRYITKFEQHFGVTTATTLDKTFRFNNSICDVASSFVLKNKEQVQKTLTTHAQVDQPMVSLLRATNLTKPKQIDQRIVQVLEQINTFAKPGSTVYLLARFTFTLPNKSQLASLNNQFENLAISGLSYHRSKGQEADYVVMLGLEAGKHGFPSQKKTHPLLDALLPEAEKHSFAEERRLFYVGLTRAKSKAYLICDMAVASEFVVELLEDESKLATRDFFMSYAQGLFQLIKCKRCETGGMVGRTSDHGDFFGCSNYPLCDNTEKACTECGNAMQHIGRYRACINPECQSSVPSCPNCGYDMAQRTGKYGEFWSCTNYRAGGPSCGHTEQVIAPYDGALQEKV